MCTMLIATTTAAAMSRRAEVSFVPDDEIIGVDGEVAASKPLHHCSGELDQDDAGWIVVVLVGAVIEYEDTIDPDLLIASVAGDDVQGVLVPGAVGRRLEGLGLIDVLHERVRLGLTHIVMRSELEPRVLESCRT